MLILLGPPFEGTNEQYSRLAQVTGLVAYDLRTKLKPGSWGVVRALADPGQSADLLARLRDMGLRVAAVDPVVGHDPDRKVVPLDRLELTDDAIQMVLGKRTMSVPYGALLAIVRGEVHLGQRPASLPSRASSSTFQAVNPSASEMAVFRESMTSAAEFDAYAAADLHFITVKWLARIDARSFDFSMLDHVSPSPAENLDALVDMLAQRAGDVRVDRSVRSSSVSSFTGRPAAARSLSPPATSSAPPSRMQTDAHFDAYSRMIAEAERQTRKQR